MVWRQWFRRSRAQTTHLRVAGGLGPVQKTPHQWQPSYRLRHRFTLAGGEFYPNGTVSIEEGRP